MFLNVSESRCMGGLRQDCTHKDITSSRPGAHAAPSRRAPRVRRKPYRHACAALCNAAIPIARHNRPAKHAASPVRARMVPAGEAAESLTSCADAAGARRA